MKKLEWKNRMEGKRGSTVFCVVMYTLLALFILGLFLFNANYNKIYRSPKVENGKVDFSGVDLPSRDVACNLNGKWEFFYNQWIVTDGYRGAADGFLRLPNVWTYRDFGKGKLPKSGYASYRLIADNVQADVDINVSRLYTNFAYRVFINGELSYRSGELSKEVKKTEVTGKTAERHPYRTDGSPLEIVIEVSATNAGGFNAAPWLSAASAGESYGSSWRSFNYVSLGIATAAVAIGILTYLFFKYKRNIFMPAFLLAIYVHFLASKDLMFVFRLPILAAIVIELFSALAAFVLLTVYFWRCGAKIQRIFAIATTTAGGLFVVLLLAFYGTPVAPWCALLLFLTASVYLIPIVFNQRFVPMQRLAYGILFSFLMSVFAFELCDALGLLVFGTEFIFTCELMLILACFAVLYLWKLAKAANTAIRVSGLESELSALKNQMLDAQIKPHFIFNSLTAIQSRYRDGMKEGDQAIAQFAKHLRLLTDANGENVIPFDEEVQNVLNYFELENLRAGKNLNLFLDLGFTDFSVPVLSLQPLVENAVQHADLNQKEDGYVQISSEKTDDGVLVVVEDNGRGFDVGTTPMGVGLENTGKRLALFGASMEINSKIGQGTRIEIKIPNEKE